MSAAVLRAAYDKMLCDSSLQHDPSQIELVKVLERYRAAVDSHQTLRTKIFSAFGMHPNTDHILKRGVYIWGGVGRGKSMILQLFFDSICTTTKRSVHFHKFMADFHQHISKWHADSTRSKSQVNDAINSIAQNYAKMSSVICLDELQVNNIADAMVMYRLFSTLLRDQCFIFFTSNFAPQHLFQDGLQRERFTPFIELVSKHLDIYHMDNADDYRRCKIANINKCYYWPLDDKAYSLIESITTQNHFIPITLKVNQTRNICILKSHHNAAIFSFAELCQNPLGILDYLAICNKFDIIFITDIPQMHSEDHNEALRLIAFIDCVYEKKKKLICTAAVSIDALYSGKRHQTEFSRTVSRLYEMQSTDYAEQHTVKSLNVVDRTQS